MPSTLGRRLLAQAKPADVTVGGAARIARRATRELIWRPHDKRSLIGQVKVWVDVDSGLPLGVEVRAVKGDARAFSSSYLDLALKAPDPSILRFNARADPTINVQRQAPGTVDGNRPMIELPPSLGGLPQRSPMSPLVATYGQGASIVGVSAIDPFLAQELRKSIDSPGRPPITGTFGEGSLIETPLLTGLIFSSDGHGYVLLGSVTRAELEAMALDLVRHPPTNTGNPQIFGGGGG